MHLFFIFTSKFYNNWKIYIKKCENEQKKIKLILSRTIVKIITMQFPVSFYDCYKI
jgi:hypothetical protein